MEESLEDEGDDVDEIGKFVDEMSAAQEEEVKASESDVKTGRVKGLECREVMNTYRKSGENYLRWIEAIKQVAMETTTTPGVVMKCPQLEDVHANHYIDLPREVALMDTASDVLIGAFSGKACIDKIPIKMPEIKGLIGFMRDMIRRSGDAVAVIKPKLDDCGISGTLQFASPRRSIYAKGVKNMKKTCEIKTVSKQVDVVGKTPDYVEFFNVGNDRFKVESDQFHAGQNAGFSLQSFDKGWNDVEFWTTPVVKEGLKTPAAIEKTWGPYINKVKTFAKKFAGCD
jgi:hypothetical protein